MELIMFGRDSNSGHRSRSFFGAPRWWSERGGEMDITEYACGSGWSKLVIASHFDTLTITELTGEVTPGSRMWEVSWRRETAMPEMVGVCTWSDDEFAAAFGISTFPYVAGLEPPRNGQVGLFFQQQYVAGKFIRWYEYLTVPGDQDGADYQRSVSVLLNPRMIEFAQQLLKRSNVLTLTVLSHPDSE